MRLGVPRPKEEARAADPLVGDLIVYTVVGYNSPRMAGLRAPSGYGDVRVDLINPLFAPWIAATSADGMTIKGTQRVSRGDVSAEYAQAWWIRFAPADAPWSSPYEHPQCGRLAGREGPL